MTYRIREVDADDEDIAAELIKLDRECFGSAAPPIEPQKEGLWWLAYFDGAPVAYAGMKPSCRWLNVGYLNRAGVLKEHRGNRLQSRLLRARERKAKKLGWIVVVSDTTDNVPSANSLIRAGYKLYRPKYPWAFGHTLYWRKVL